MIDSKGMKTKLYKAGIITNRYNSLSLDISLSVLL